MRARRHGRDPPSGRPGREAAGRCCDRRVRRHRLDRLEPHDLQGRPAGAAAGRARARRLRRARAELRQLLGGADRRGRGRRPVRRQPQGPGDGPRAQDRAHPRGPRPPALHRQEIGVRRLHQPRRRGDPPAAHLGSCSRPTATPTSRRSRSPIGAAASGACNTIPNTTCTSSPGSATAGARSSPTSASSRTSTRPTASSASSRRCTRTRAARTSPGCSASTRTS